MAKEALKPLTPSELYDLLDVEKGVVLVAGQALAFWGDYFDVVPPSGLSAGLTFDVDILGTTAQAARHADGLKVAFGSKVEFTPATIDTPPPTAAVILLRDVNGRDEPIVIDYLTALMGYVAKDEDRLKRLALPVSFFGREVLVMHPFDCLKSRLHNYIELPEKRNEMGLGQLLMSIAVVSAYLRDACARGEERAEALPVAEKVFSLAASRDGLRLWNEQGVDLLNSVPVEVFTGKFPAVRWPQINEFVARRRESLRRAIRGGR